MGLLTSLGWGLLQGTDRIIESASNLNSRSHNKGRGTKTLSYSTSNRKSVKIKELAPVFIVPILTDFKLELCVSDKAP